MVKCYSGVLNKSPEMGLYLINSEEMLQNSHVMALFVQGVINLETLLRTESLEHDEPSKRILECTQLRRLGISMSMNESLQPSNLPYALKKNLHFARDLETCQNWREDLIL